MTDLYKWSNNSLLFDIAYKKSPAFSRALFNYFLFRSMDLKPPLHNHPLFCQRCRNL